VAVIDVESSSATGICFMRPTKQTVAALLLIHFLVLLKSNAILGHKLVMPHIVFVAGIFRSVLAPVAAVPFDFPVADRKENSFAVGAGYLTSRLNPAIGSLARFADVLQSVSGCFVSCKGSLCFCLTAR